MIREVVVTTVDASGEPHLAPLGIIEEEGGWIIAPFRPSTTLDNLLSVPYATVNYIDDPRVFAGLVTGRRDWPLEWAPPGRPPRLSAALSHAELRVVEVEDHRGAAAATAASRARQARTMRRSRASTAPPTPCSNARS